MLSAPPIQPTLGVGGLLPPADATAPVSDASAPVSDASAPASDATAAGGQVGAFSLGAAGASGLACLSGLEQHQRRFYDPI